jgi:RNA 2',3'-cyclic 3'-phosphodiesterase
VAAGGVEGGRLRLFVALDLSQNIREALIAWRSRVTRQIPELRPVAHDALHVTLCFLGSQSAGEDERIAAACETALGGAPSPELRLDVGLWLPPRRPRVLAIRLHDSSQALARIQARVASALCDGGWYAPEKRPFLPHVTVARVPARARVRVIDLPELQPLRFVASAVTLYRSHLQRSGARYEPVARVLLSYREPVG